MLVCQNFEQSGAQRWAKGFRTRRRYIPVGSSAASLLQTVLKPLTQPYYNASLYPGKEAYLFLAGSTKRGRDMLSGTVSSRDAAEERTGKYSQRVPESVSLLLNKSQPNNKEAFTACSGKRICPPQPLAFKQYKEAH